MARFASIDSNREACKVGKKSDWLESCLWLIVLCARALHEIFLFQSQFCCQMLNVTWRRSGDDSRNALAMGDKESETMLKAEAFDGNVTFVVWLQIIPESNRSHAIVITRSTPLAIQFRHHNPSRVHSKTFRKKRCGIYCCNLWKHPLNEHYGWTSVIAVLTKQFISDKNAVDWRRCWWNWKALTLIFIIIA